MIDLRLIAHAADSIHADALKILSLVYHMYYFGGSYKTFLPLPGRGKH